MGILARWAAPPGLARSSKNSTLDLAVVLPLLGGVVLVEDGLDRTLARRHQSRRTGRGGCKALAHRGAVTGSLARIFDRTLPDLPAHEGLNNRSIAAELVLFERTVEVHACSTLTKGKLSNRHEIPAWALRDVPAPKATGYGLRCVRSSLPV